VTSKWIRKDLEGSGRGPILRYFPSFVRRNWGKPRKTSVSTAGLQAQIFEPGTSWIRSRSAHGPRRSVLLLLCYVIFVSEVARNSTVKSKIIKLSARTGAAQSVLCLRVRFPGKQFSSSLCVQTSSEAHPASYPVGTGDSFPAGEARLRRDANCSSSSSTEVKNE
jgi:hypothetical protein